MSDWKIPLDPRRSLRGKLVRRARLVARGRLNGLDELDGQIDVLYRLIDEREGRVYVPRFRTFQRISESQLNAVADVLRDVVNLT